MSRKTHFGEEPRVQLVVVFLIVALLVYAVVALRYTASSILDHSTERFVSRVGVGASTVNQRVGEIRTIAVSAINEPPEVGPTFPRVAPRAGGRLRSFAAGRSIAATKVAAGTVSGVLAAGSSLPSGSQGNRTWTVTDSESLEEAHEAAAEAEDARRELSEEKEDDD